MKIGPKYKIARRLGAPIFEKTQTQKYTLSLARKEKGRRSSSRPKSEFGLQLIEKQKARLSYGVGERQFKNYVKKALRTAEPIQKLFAALESRLDNVIFRAGIAKTRAQARQAASHGHVLLNGRRVTIPSIALAPGDLVALSPKSKESPLFGEAEERMKTVEAPAWLELDPAKREVKVKGIAAWSPTEHIFDLNKVIEFYNR